MGQHAEDRPPFPTERLHLPGLRGKAAIVTGGGHGLGFAAARALVGQGVNLLLSGRDEAALARARAALAALDPPVEVESRVADVRSSAAADALAAAALERWGRVDVLVNNAGINVIKPSEDLTDAEWQAVLDTDLSGPFFCARAVAPAMLAQGSGCIVNISSIVGLVGLPRRAAYASAKHGLIGLTKVLAVEWGRHNVRVNAICPGMFPLPDKPLGPMGVSAQELVERTPMKRFGRPEEVGDLVCFLASDAGAFISGAAIPIDGAWTAFGGWRSALPDAP